MKHILLVLNPHAGGGRAQSLSAAIEREFDRQGIRLSLYRSTAPGSIRSCLAARELSDVDAVVAGGGDGTLFEALNGLMAHPAARRPPLGLLPVGTGNAVSRDLGLPAGDWQAAMARLLQGNIRRVDIGQLDCTQGRWYFLNMVGQGFVVAAGSGASRLKRIGKSAYTLAALWQTLRLSSSRMQLRIDGRLIEQDSLLLEIANSRFTGTDFLIAPAARLDDGLLDLILVRRLSRLRLLRLFPTIYSGAHVNYPEVTVMQGREFEILQPAGSPLMIDGEFAGVTPATIRCLPSELNMLV